MPTEAMKWIQFGVARRLNDAMSATERLVMYSTMPGFLPARDSGICRYAGAALNVATCLAEEKGIGMSVTRRESL